MSGRPADPSYTVEAFAPDANYPAGAETWSSNPCKVAPPGAASVGFTPGQGNAAQYHNYLHNRRYQENENAKMKIADLYTYLGQVQALNFGAPVAQTGAPTLAWALFVPANRRWYTFGSSREARKSVNGGYTWDLSTLIGVGAGTEACCMADCDASGNLVVAQTATSDMFTYAAGTDTWAENTSIGATPLSGRTNVVYDPIHTRWCFYGIDAGGTFYCYTSTDRSTWTAATPAANVLAETSTAVRMGVDKVTGRLVQMCYVSTSGSFSLATSDDGGQNWTKRGEFASTITSATLIELAHNPDTGKWILTIGESSGTHSCEAWTSSDGVTWTKVCTLANYALMHCAPVGNMWVSTTRSGEVVYSLDDGATWKLAGISGPTHGVFSGYEYGQLLAINGVTSNGTVYVGMRAGLVGDALT